MPLYDYECPGCGLQTDVWAKIEEQEKLCGCMQWMKRVISPTRGNPDIQPYLDENLCADHSGQGTWVKSKQHRRQVMSELGLTDKWGEGGRQRWV
jgi:putative FmdB family regulatory protein